MRGDSGEKNCPFVDSDLPFSKSLPTNANRTYEIQFCAILFIRAEDSLLFFAQLVVEKKSPKPACRKTNDRNPEDKTSFPLYFSFSKIAMIF